MVKKTTKIINKATEKGVKKALNKPMTCTTTPSCSTGHFSYFLGFLGAAIYYLSNTTGFWAGLLGLIKAAIWPLFLVLEALRFFLG